MFDRWAVFLGQPLVSDDAGQIVLQLDENGAPTHRYLWGPAVDMLLADEWINPGGAQLHPLRRR